MQICNCANTCPYLHAYLYTYYLILFMLLLRSIKTNVQMIQNKFRKKTNGIVLQASTYLPTYRNPTYKTYLTVTEGPNKILLCYDSDFWVLT